MSADKLTKTFTAKPAGSGVDGAAWQASWDRQQEAYLPDREHRFAAMLDTLEAVCPSREPTVLDLAGGTGSISLRVLRRFPRARTTLVDVDPVLLAIARATLDERTTLITADLRDPAWPSPLLRTGYDAVLTATALHWIAPERLEKLFGEVHGLLRPGGIFINADHMPDDGLPRLTAQLGERERRTREALWAAGAALSWDEWWERVAADATLGALLPRRAAVFAQRHPAEFTPPLSWHVQALRAAGFAEVGTVWRGGRDAAVAAVR
jgi:SAM-dependent methyltransferase